MGQALSKEEQIEALEQELFALRQPSKKFDSVQVLCMAYQPANNTPKATPLTTSSSIPAPATKPADKGKAPEHPVTNKQLPVTKEPVAQPPATPLTTSNSIPAPAAKPADKGKAPEHPVANKQPPVTKEPVAQPPVHPFSSIPSCYTLPLIGISLLPTDLTTAHIKLYHLSTTLSSLKQYLKGFQAPRSVSVGKLYLVSQNIRNQFRMAVMPKQLVGASTNTVQNPSNIFEDILPTFAIEEPQFSLGSNTATANRLTLDKALLTSVDPIEAYIDLLPLGEEPVVLTVAKDSQSLQSVIMLIDNKEEIECITNSGS
ncbi:hypothetical protein C0989_011316 [Termitomyces sp. Mn162]|nr:hypothetical protein C0989_011316 [Termitomyces sp. Mn162]